MRGTGGLQHPHPHGRASTRVPCLGAAAPVGARGPAAAGVVALWPAAERSWEVRGVKGAGNVPPALQSGVTPGDK